jgi:predicted HAD superfamily Cof-like phosphohydrolase
MLVSETFMVNLATMAASSKHDQRQTPGKLYTIPDEDTRILRARLLLEECLETINAMGIRVDAIVQTSNMPIASNVGEISTKLCMFHAIPNVPVNIVDVIDGCVDLNFVSTGTLAAFGVPDTHHTEVVNFANLDKFKNGAIVDVNGKFQKPEGWESPENYHRKLMEVVNDDTPRPSIVDFCMMPYLGHTRLGPANKMIQDFRIRIKG